MSNSSMLPIDGPQLMLALLARVELEAMTMKEYSTFSKSQELGPQNLMG